MTHRSCAACTFSEIAMRDNGPTLECRRNPPAGEAGIMMEPEIPEGLPSDIAEPLGDVVEAVVEIGTMEFPRFPAVADSDWCGEFSPKVAPRRRWFRAQP